MMDSGKIKLLLEGDVPPPLTKRDEPKKVKAPGRPTSMKRAMVKEPREKIPICDRKSSSSLWFPTLNMISLR